jgi:DNA primase
MISPESIRKVIDRADIVEVIGQFLNLKKRGVNYLANCPFHNEKTPSFNVNPSKGIFKCFGCGKGGDTVAFIEEYEHFSFVESVRWLADFYQIELEETEAPQEFKQLQQTEESLRIINDFATEYFQNILTNNEEGKIIGGGYFKERGFSEDTIADFRLGYCLDQWESFSKAALSRGYDIGLLEKSGLVKIRDGKPFDNYKGRVIFPIFSPTGKVLGFGARILKKNDKAPKYVNSPENELYVKNKVLYGLYQSRQAIRKENDCFLVEGYTDVISLHQGGVKNVVASSGTSLTEGQLKLISNLTKNLTILYDGDAAGVKAAMRGLDMALGESFNVKLVLLPEGEDPDSFIQKTGEQDFRDYIRDHKRDVIEFRLEVGLKEAAGDPLKKAQLVNEVAETISKINKAEDFTLQQHYIRKCATDLNIEEEGLINLVNKFIREKVQQDDRQQKRAAEQAAAIPDPITPGQSDDDVIAAAQQLISPDSREEWQLLRVLLEYGDKPYGESNVAQYFFETIDLELLENGLAKKMALDYYNYWSAHRELPGEQYFIKHPDRTIRHKAVDLFYEQYVPSSDWKEMHKIDVPFGTEIYQTQVASTFAYFELKLIRSLLQENWKQMQTEKDAEQMEMLIKTHLSLKEREKGLMSIVIVK